MNRMFFLTAFVWVMAMPFSAFPHGTDYRLIDKDAVVAAEFFYSDKTPMQYSEVLIFSPINEKVEYQYGRTDQNGRFAFLANRSGQWQIKVSDGMGHAVHATFTVNSEKKEPKTTGEISDKRRNGATKKNVLFFEEASMGVKLVFGLSILLNLFLGVYVWKRKA